ncbi:SDR family oxidoreductase [Flavobacterium subsaxonicum]|uniref:Short-chain dehydrogenase n=1 Tax=Flavobacterium subsaxonicum WB 4.1-42 = DSM 21790 TaxID=1121898 RepID=A0A0A2MGJ3_9FLAO|nr:SDR family NAD(P)-dependent oxidoreductase [Flavobacterium subsaxonicum]KGO91414.1 short-chain dehydrogenase [Flavobacterium subsaxonicum WB 4.1-42 = DSM 21790]
MKTTDNTVLITGGSAGIGLALAERFIAEGNHVIITGRDQNRLNEAAAQLGNKVTAIAFDVSKPEDVTALVARLTAEFPNLNVLINNAGQAYYYKLDENADAFAKAEHEMLVNYLSVIRLTEKLLPLLKQQPEAAVVNVSSIAAFVPNAGIPTYSASKAALHSYSQSLRLLLEDTQVKVFELMPPLVNTSFSKDIGGENGIAPSVLADDLLAAFASDTYQIHTGNTALIYELSKSDPAAAFAAMNSRG